MSKHQFLGKQKNLSNAEIMAHLNQETFEAFCQDAEANFDDRFNEWHLSNFKWDYFHYFSRTIPESDREGLYRKAYEHLQMIAAHQGRMNIHGVFLNPEEVVIFESKNRVHATIKIEYSEITRKWYYGLSYSYGNGGGGVGCSICCNERVNQIYSAESKEQALLKGAETMHESFSRNSSMDEAQQSRSVKLIETFMTDILSRSNVAIPSVLQQKAVAVQGCLF